GGHQRAGRARRGQRRRLHAEDDDEAGGRARVGPGQRQALVRPASAQRGANGHPGLRDAANAPSRIEAGALMAEHIQTLGALDGGVDQALLRAALPNDGGIEIIGIVDGLNESWQTLQETSPDLVVVACAGYSDRAIYFIDSAVKQSRERPVVVLTTGSPNGFVRRVFESGADDIVTLPEDPDRVGFTLMKAIARRQGAAIASGVALGAMICVLGPKGGTGKTLTATNLATALARRGERTVIVDLDLQFGDVGLALGLRPDKTVYDLARSGGSLDAEKLDAYLVDHA